VSKEIWLGPLLGNNRAKLIARCSQLISAGKPQAFVYLAASHPLLDLVSQSLLDGDVNRGVWGELPVYLFRGFVRRILGEALDANGDSLPPRMPIDGEDLPLKRSLVSQVLSQLTAAGKLKAIGPLANREGCVNTIATLIGEIERSAKSPEEVAAILASRAADMETKPQKEPLARLNRQTDFDQEVALIYSVYSDLLDRNQLTEADADQLRALTILDSDRFDIPWLRQVELLVLDGFFDFTPVQGEILRRVIPRVPDVLVNLNHDDRNPEIFLPFQETVEQLSSMSEFDIKHTESLVASSAGVLSQLRQNLFNLNASVEADEADAAKPQAEIRYFECGDRETEIRQIVKEIKRLLLNKQFCLSDIGLVVRQRAAYANTIARVMREESLPCNIESRVAANDIPATRAVLKLLAILEKMCREESAVPRVSELADLVKSEYFRLTDQELDQLGARFDEMHIDLLRDSASTGVEQIAKLKQRYRIGVWDADALENAFAYVGSDLRVRGWVERAAKLIKELPNAAATRELLNIESVENARDPDEADQVANAETAKVEAKDVERKRRPSRDVHPASLAWTSLVLQRLAEHLHAIEREGSPVALRLAVMRLLDRFSFQKQVTQPIRRVTEDEDLPQAITNYNSLEALRRAFAAAIKSIEIANSLNEKPKDVVALADFIAEVRRALGSQSQVICPADRNGLRVLEATDVRGLRFRVVFIAGLTEGGFPLRASRDWIYPHEERERLKHYGLTLEDISPATLLKEEHYFYQTACRAVDRLYLSRPLVLEDDSETVGSYYLDELRRAIAPFEIKAETIRRDYEGQALDDVSSVPELDITLIRQQERHAHRGPKHELLPQPQIKRLLTLARNDGLLSDSALRRIEIERERASKRFGPYDGVITDPRLLTLLQQRFGPQFVHSASGLSTYGNCAYRFFGQRILKLEPRGEAALDLQAIDAGKLLHDILRRFFERHRRERLDDKNRAKLQEELRELADRVFDEHERVVPPLNRQIWKIDREIRKILLDQVLLYEIDIQEHARESGTLPAYFEVSFGGTKSAARDPNSIEEPLRLRRSTFVGEETIDISGQIDRVDVAADDTAIAYDYKLSTGSTLQDIKSGRSLQLPIYLEALERVLLPNHPIGGGGYYVIRGGTERRNKGLHRAEALKYTKLRANVTAVVGDEEWNRIRSDVIARIWDFLDQMRAGQFGVSPSEKEKTCRFCDFAAVCRYERYRIDNKKVDAER